MNWVMMLGIAVTVVTAIPVVLQLRSHPRGLVVLFFAEMWERFSYYGMRGLLIFYLTQQFLFDDKFSQGQYGAYTALVYLTPPVGGFVADRFLGTRKAIVFGALLLVVGHMTMGIEGKPATQVLHYGERQYVFNVEGRGDSRHVRLKVDDKLYDYAPAADGGLQIKDLPAASPLPSVLPKGSYSLSVQERDPLYVNIFYLALSLIVLGVGFLKPNISAIVGQLYPERDPRRDPGFTLFYYGINLGSFWAGLLCGLLGEKVGWWAGFGMAGVGMLAGFVVFVLGKPLLMGKGEPPDPVKLAKPVAGPINLEWSIYLLSLLGLAVVFFLVQRNAVVGYILLAGSAATLAYLGWFMTMKCTKIERERLMLALTLILGSVVFWALFEQAGSSLNQFAQRNTQLAISATQNLAAAQTQAFNPFFILLFAPVFSALWAFLGRRGADPNPVVKFGLALLQVGLGFFVLVWGSSFADADHRVPLMFLLLAYLLHTTGELCLSPVGLSWMTKLSPAAVVATIMATWFLGTSGGQMVAGLVAQLTAAETVAGVVLDPAKALETYVGVFRMIGFWGVGLGALLLLLSPVLKRWAHGVDKNRTAEEIEAAGLEPAPSKPGA